MAEMTIKSVDRAIERHAMWLRDKATGAQADFTGQTLNRLFSRYSECDLRFAVFRGADLSELDLTRARLAGADLQEANLMNTRLTQADLVGADLTGAYVFSTRLSGAKLTDAKLQVRAHPSDGQNLLSADYQSDLVSEILAAIDAGEVGLDMAAWHSRPFGGCGTAHCLAGWATTIHANGRCLESSLGTNAAAALIYQACVGEVPDYYSTRDEAYRWLRKHSVRC